MMAAAPGKILASNFIPMEPEEITAEWLFEVINQYRALREMSLVKDPDDLVACEIAEKKSSKGRLSSTYIIDIKFKCFTSMGNEMVEMGFFLKLLPSVALVNGEKNRAMARKLNTFPKEVKVTFGVLPRIQKTAAKFQLKLAIPEIVYGSHDGRGNGVVVLMSEESGGYECATQCSGLTLPQVSAVLDRLSEIHAASAFMLISGEPLDDLVAEEENGEEECNATREEMDLVFRSLAHFLKRVPGYLDGHYLIDKFRAALIAIARRQTAPQTRLPLQCMIHGELYERNILFKQTRRSKSSGSAMTSRRQGSVDFTDDSADDEDDRANASSVDVNAIITDWKLSGISSPTEDLAFFFFSSTSRSLREKYAQDWLEQYYFSFTECLRSKFGIKLANIYPDFDFDVFCKNYKSQLQRAHLQAVLVLTRELRFLENEFHYVKDNKEKERLGDALKLLGRRLLEVVDDLVTAMSTKEWRRDHAHLLVNPTTIGKREEGVEETVSATIKLANK